MTPRPRTIPDEAILEATGRVIGQLGPARFTLADVATEVGLSPATLVEEQRTVLLTWPVPAFFEPRLEDLGQLGVDRDFADPFALAEDPQHALAGRIVHPVRECS